MSFARAIAYILRPDVEGGLSDDPADPGGLTNLGYSLRAHPEMTADEIRNLTPMTVGPLYLRDYFQPIHGDELPNPISFALFDCAINSGVSEAIKLLQHALSVTVDGVMGPQTIRAACVAPTKTLVRDFSEARLALMESLPNYAHDGRGWRRRVIQTAIEAFQ
jgi:lysozyme family protein